MKKEKRTSNDLQNITQKTKDRVTLKPTANFTLTTIKPMHSEHLI